MLPPDRLLVLPPDRLCGFEFPPDRLRDFDEEFFEVLIDFFEPLVDLFELLERLLLLDLELPWGILPGVLLDISSLRDPGLPGNQWFNLWFEHVARQLSHTLHAVQISPQWVVQANPPARKAQLAWKPREAKQWRRQRGLRAGAHRAVARRRRDRRTRTAPPGGAPGPLPDERARPSERVRTAAARRLHDGGPARGHAAPRRAAHPARRHRMGRSPRPAARSRSSRPRRRDLCSRVELLLQASPEEWH